MNDALKQVTVISKPFSNSEVGSRNLRDRPLPSSTQPVTIDPSELSTKTSLPGMFSYAVNPRFRPVTMHDSSFNLSLDEGQNAFQDYHSLSIPLQPFVYETVESSLGGPDLHHPSAMGNNNLNFSTHADGTATHLSDTEMYMGQAFTTDEVVPILDLGYSARPDYLNMTSDLRSRRMSSSSFTQSTNDSPDEMVPLPHEDIGFFLAEANPFTADCAPPSKRNSLMSSVHFSPVASPQTIPQNRCELVRAQSRGRASPRSRMRTAPYTMDSTRNKRWSTGSYASVPVGRPSPFVYQQRHKTLSLDSTRRSQHSSPTLPETNALHMSTRQSQQQQQQQQHVHVVPSSQVLNSTDMLLNTQPYPPAPHFERRPPPPLIPHNLIRMLPSNTDTPFLHSHPANPTCTSPNLFASLHDAPLAPPASDMNPLDPALTPREQELRFPGDLYTPRWVRGHGNKREGWCGICKPGRWLVLKNSAFWYDKSFAHGISAASGSAFQEARETRRMAGSPETWEGLCGSCGEWVPLVSSKKKGTTWFRHAYKCHTHPKIKDAPKRRRESSHIRILDARAKREGSSAMSATPTSTQAALSTEIPLSTYEDLYGMI